MMRVLALLLLLAAPAWGGTEYYIATDGTDPESGCTGGTSGAPWATWKVPQANGCIAAGDTIYFVAGTYTYDTHFESNDGLYNKITFPGTSNTTIAPAPGTAEYGVKFQGPIVLYGSYGTLRGIEVYSDAATLSAADSGKVILYQDANDTIVDACYIHGLQTDVDITKAASAQTYAYDCIKVGVGSTGTRRHDTTIQSSKIYYCSEDAIDLAGSEDVIIRQNDIYYVIQSNIKGGTENVTIDRNLFRTSYEGFKGGDMTCTGAYCGSPDIPALAFTSRFVAKNLTFTNNIFDSITGSRALGIQGWVDTTIYHNTWTNCVLNVYAAPNGFDFYDATAIAWCAANPGECDSCGEGCYRYRKFRNANVNFKNNIVYGTSTLMRYAAAADGTGITADYNVHYRSGATSVFRIDTPSIVTYTLAQWVSAGYEGANSEYFDPLLSTYTPASGSPAVNAGADDLGITTDYYAHPRPYGAGFDIGAVEYFPASLFRGGSAVGVGLR